VRCFSPNSAGSEHCLFTSHLDRVATPRQRPAPGIAATPLANPGMLTSLYVTSKWLPSYLADPGVGSGRGSWGITWRERPNAPLGGLLRPDVWASHVPFRAGPRARNAALSTAYPRDRGGQPVRGTRTADSPGAGRGDHGSAVNRREQPRFADRTGRAATPSVGGPCHPPSGTAPQQSTGGATPAHRAQARPGPGARPESTRSSRPLGHRP
jgi:hypothetical protein